MVTYEERLAQNLGWAFQEAGMHFEQDNAVHRTLRKITKRLNDLDIPYALAGAMSMFVHGFRRFTEDVDLLVTREGLEKLHEHLEGLGYVPVFTGSKNLRDADSGVRIEFLIAGEFPGDGTPKPVAFPDPIEAGVVLQGIRCLTIPKLVELKLASGMTNPGRLKDLGDVQEMIKVRDLQIELADQLNLFVRDKYRELWTAVKNNPA